MLCMNFGEDPRPLLWVTAKGCVFRVWKLYRQVICIKGFLSTSGTKKQVQSTAGEDHIVLG